MSQANPVNDWPHRLRTPATSPPTRRGRRLPARRCCCLVLFVLLLGPGRSAGQARVAPVYGLPAEGAWVEYEWRADRPGGRPLKGTLRVSFVGQEDVRGAPHCWIELKKEFEDGGRGRRQLRKLLIARKALEQGEVTVQHVARAYRQDGPNEPVTSLSGPGLQALLDLGFGPEAPLKVFRDREEVETGLGHFTARHVWAAGKGKARAREYHGWLTGRVPFGWARFEVREAAGAGPARCVFQAVARKSGRGARSEAPNNAVRP